MSLLLTGQLPAVHTTQRHLGYVFRGVPVDVLVFSASGHEAEKRPVLLFIQGSLPIPLQVTSAEGDYGIFPFSIDSIVCQFHLVIIGKPGIPLSVPADSLQPDFSYRDPATGKVPDSYCFHNRRSWYLARNAYVLGKILKLPWVDQRRVVVAGHSEGATIAADMAATMHTVTHLIFMSGNPLGRIHTMLTQERMRDGNPDGIVMHFHEIMKDPDRCDCTDGDPNVTTAEFSVPPIEQFERIHIPVLLVWGTRDACSAGMDFLQLTAIRKGWKNIYSDPWPGLDHNFFGSDAEGNPDPEQFMWDLVMLRALAWTDDPGKLR